MAQISDDDLQKQRDNNNKLREQIAAEQAKQVTAEVELDREIQMAQLQAENERLAAQLAEAKATSTKTAVRQGAALPLEQAKQQMEAAVAARKAAEEGVSVPDNTAAEKQAEKASAGEGN